MNHAADEVGFGQLDAGVSIFQSHPRCLASSQRFQTLVQLAPAPASVPLSELLNALISDGAILAAKDN